MGIISVKPLTRLVFVNIVCAWVRSLHHYFEMVVFMCFSWACYSSFRGEDEEKYII